MIKVLNLWQKSGIYSPEVIQPLLNLPSSLSEGKNDLKKCLYRHTAWNQFFLLWIKYFYAGFTLPVKYHFTLFMNLINLKNKINKSEYMYFHGMTFMIRSCTLQWWNLSGDSLGVPPAVMVVVFFLPDVWSLYFARLFSQLQCLFV